MERDAASRQRRAVRPLPVRRTREVWNSRNPKRERDRRPEREHRAARSRRRRADGSPELVSLADRVPVAVPDRVGLARLRGDCRRARRTALRSAGEPNRRAAPRAPAGLRELPADDGGIHRGERERHAAGMEPLRHRGRGEAALSGDHRVGRPRRGARGGAVELRRAPAPLPLRCRADRADRGPRRLLPDRPSSGPTPSHGWRRESTSVARSDAARRLGVRWRAAGRRSPARCS